MAGSTGYSSIVTNGLVFAYDVADIINSYAGEPTTNLLPNAQLNGYPTYGNYWYTYNTNQYCGNNGCAVYWTIPNIASVSSNIVTTVNSHQIRTYDVINPETTGGGVSAGVNYFAKKISDTQFSLHAYNSSQDGSQGYINSATGLPTVWDSIAYDQRVSVNASSFPTKWWGAPHLPNSGLVKEIRPRGFTNPNTGVTTDCIRCHWIRPDGVTDGMSYGPDASFTPNQDVACSFWMKAVSPSAVGQGVTFYHYTYGVTSPTAYSMYATIGPVGVWQKYSYTFNSPNNTAISYWFPGYGPMVADISNIQIEQKSHATPFVVGTRSNTQGLLNLTSTTNVMDLSNVSFDSNAQMYFDGINDYIDTGKTASQLGMYDQSYTAECVCYPTNFSGDRTMFGTDQTAFRQGLHLVFRSGTIYMGHYSSDYSAGSGTLNAWNHIVYRFDVSTGAASIFKNGVLQGTGTISSFIGTTNILLGRWASGQYFSGNIAVQKIYNRPLSDGEILTNFNHYKTRYNLP